MLKILFLAIRPKTLPAAIVPVWVGCVLAYAAHGVFDFSLAVATVASALFIQIASNLFNDAIDGKKGADTAERVGPRRVTASGLMRPGTVMALGALSLVLAALFAWPLIAARGWPILAIGIPSLYFSFGYTGGPLPLAYRGLGEIFVLLFFGLIAVTGTVYVQAGVWDPLATLAGLQVGALSTALIATNNLRDAEEDTKTGKHTLAVRFGVRWARREVTVLLLVPFVLGIIWWPVGHAGLAIGPFLGLPLALSTARAVAREEPGPVFNRLLARAGLLMIIHAIGFQLGALLGR